MLKFIEFTFTETDKDMKLYAKLSDGSLVYIRDYDYLYDIDLQFYRDEQGRFTDVYCQDGSYEIRDGKLFKVTFDHNGEALYKEIGKHRDLIPAPSHQKISDKPVSPFSL